MCCTRLSFLLATVVVWVFMRVRVLVRGLQKMVKLWESSAERINTVCNFSCTPPPPPHPCTPPLHHSLTSGALWRPQSDRGAAGLRAETSCHPGAEVDEPGQAKGITLLYIYSSDSIDGLLCKLTALPVSYIRVFQVWQHPSPEAVSENLGLCCCCCCSSRGRTRGIIQQNRNQGILFWGWQQLVRAGLGGNEPMFGSVLRQNCWAKNKTVSQGASNLFQCLLRWRRMWLEERRVA